MAEVGRILIVGGGVAGLTLATPLHHGGSMAIEDAVALGEILDMDQGRLSCIECGKHRLRDIETIVRVASRLGIPPALLGFRAGTTNEAVQSGAPAQDLPTEPAPGVDSLTSPPDSPSPRITSEGSQGQLDDEATPSPSLTKFGPVGDVAALCTANLALFTAAAHGINTAKGYNELLTSSGPRKVEPHPIAKCCIRVGFRFRGEGRMDHESVMYRR